MSYSQVDLGLTLNSDFIKLHIGKTVHFERSRYMTLSVNAIMNWLAIIILLICVLLVVRIV